MLLQVDAGGQPVHAGRLGGAVVDPSMVLAQILTRMQAAVSAMTAAAQVPGLTGARGTGRPRATAPSGGLQATARRVAQVWRGGLPGALR